MNWYKEANIKDTIHSFFRGLGISTLMWATVFLGYAALHNIMVKNKNNPAGAIAEVERIKADSSQVNLTLRKMPGKMDKHKQFNPQKRQISWRKRK